MSTRFEKLQELLAQDPQNAFLRYALAQELFNQSRLEEAAGEFARLVETHPDYCYAYFHGGRTLEKLGRSQEARELYRRGIQAAIGKGDEKARSELEAALENCERENTE